MTHTCEMPNEAYRPWEIEWSKSHPQIPSRSEGTLGSSRGVKMWVGGVATLEVTFPENVKGGLCLFGHGKLNGENPMSKF